METQIKKAIKAGNSSAVILPRAWLNKQVRVEIVEKTPEIILNEAIEILRKHVSLEKVIGIYLTGSYARGEEDAESDIDILVISDNIDREIINEGAYNILIVSQHLLNQKLISNLLPIGQMLKEAKPLLNSDYIKDMEIKVTKKNIKWFLDTSEEKLKIAQEYLKDCNEKNKKYVEDRVAYTLVLRIRTLDIIKSLIENKMHSKKEFLKLINKVSASRNAYEGYIRVKNNEKEEKKTSLQEAERLYNFLKDELERVKKIIRSMNV
jgi:hypothetical protein